MNRANVPILNGQPHDEDGPVFAEPWQAQAFAMTVKLHEAGVFTWQEWATCLSEQITQAQADGDPDHGDTYYQHWLRALEVLLASKSVVSEGEREARTEAWHAAALATPHGEPIQLAEAARKGSTS